MFSCSPRCQRIWLHGPPSSGCWLQGTQHLPQKRIMMPIDHSNPESLMESQCWKCTPVLLCTNLTVQHNRWGRPERIFINFSRCWSNISLIGCFLRLDRVVARGRSVQDVCLTGGDLGLAPQSSRRHLNGDGGTVTPKNVKALFILSTSINSRFMLPSKI